MTRDARTNLVLAAALGLLLLGLGLRLHSMRSRAAPAPGPAAPAPGACAHGLVAERCPFCRPERVAAGGWCQEHAVPEALCTLCRGPALVAAFQRQGDWCAEHGLPESQCVRCGARPMTRAELEAPSSPAPVESRTARTGLEARRRAPPAPGCRTHAEPVRLAGPDVAAAAGIEAAPVRAEPVADTVEAVFELAWAQDGLARLAARAAGVVVEVRAAPGQVVAAGEPLVVLEAPALGEARVELRAAQARAALRERALAREQALSAEGVGARRAALEVEASLEEARAAVAVARQRLLGLGLTAAEADAADGPPLLTLRAPRAGVVVERAVVPGDVVEVGRALLTVADARRRWALVRVPEADEERVRPGQPATLHLDAAPGEPLRGEVAWVDAVADRATRSLVARVELRLDDAAHAHAGLRGRAVVTVGPRRDALLVPRDAVQWEGCCHVVFVRLDAATFEPRKVRLGGAHGALVEVEHGLAAGELVVVQGAFTLKAQLLASSIGAGCCEEDAPR